MNDLIIPDSRFEMPSLFYPKRKPVGNVKIDWSHPLAKGLVGACLGRVNLVTGELYELKGYNLPTFERNNINLNSYGSLNEIRTTPISGSQNRTFFGAIHHASSNKGFLFNIGDGSAGVANARWSIRVDASIGLRIEMQGSGYTSSLVANAGKHHIACRLSGTQLQDNDLYVDGVFESAIGTNTVNTSSSYVVSYGNRAYDGTQDDSVDSLEVGLIYNRDLSDKEIRLLDANPYQFLIPA